MKFIGKQTKVAVAAYLVMTLLSVMVLSGPLERLNIDLLNFQAPSSKPTDDIVIVAIDEDSCAAFETQWPWPREFHGMLIERLIAEGAAQIVFDVIFSEPSSEESDSFFAQQIANAGNVANDSPSIGLDPEYTMCDRLINTASNDLGNSFGAGLAADSSTPATATSPDRGPFWGGGGGGSGAQAGANGTAGGNGYGMGAESASDDGGGGGSLGNGGSRNGTPDPSPGYGGGGAGSDGNEGGQTGGDGVIIIEYWDG